MTMLDGYVSRIKPDVLVIDQLDKVNVAGQFGGTRMGEFGSRALRDTQEAVLNQQAQAAQQGYGQALSASQADLARQAQLAGTVGSISGADLSRVLQGAGQYQNLAQTAGSLTGQQQQNLTNLGQTSGQMTAQQMQNLANIGSVQQQFSQQQLDAIRNLPLEQQQIINQALGLNVGGGSGMQTSSTSRQGLLGLLGI